MSNRLIYRGLCVLVILFFESIPTKCQSYQDRITAVGEVYFFPLEKVRVLTDFERRPDWSRLAVRDLELGMEFQLPTDGGGPYLTDVAYVEDLDGYLLKKFNSQIFNLFEKHLEVPLTMGKKADLDQDANYYYVDLVISSAFTEENGLILYQDLDGAISVQLTIGASLREHRPDQNSKEIAGAYVYTFVKESTADDIERGISSPVLKAVGRARDKYAKKLEKAFAKIEARVDKKLPGKLTEPR